MHGLLLHHKLYVNGLEGLFVNYAHVLCLEGPLPARFPCVCRVLPTLLGVFDLLLALLGCFPSAFVPLVKLVKPLLLDYYLLGLLHCLHPLLKALVVKFVGGRFPCLLLQTVEFVQIRDETRYDIGYPCIGPKEAARTYLVATSRAFLFDLAVVIFDAL